MSVGPAEILVILIVGLLVFGPQRLPEVGRQVGAALRELRKMQDTVRGELDMVLHPEHGTSSSSVAAVEPDDHSMVDGSTVEGSMVEGSTVEGSTVEGSVVDPAGADHPPAAVEPSDDPRFTGPSDSFI
jgi:Tat protein translocase TatB subunit